jgi:hypothetical protein
MKEIFTIVGILDKILSAIREWKSTSSEEERKKLCERVRNYHRRLKEACEKDSKVYRLASNIEKDHLFCIAVGYDEYGKILTYLRNLDKLTSRQKEFKKQMCRDLLSGFESIWKELL